MSCNGSEHGAKEARRKYFIGHWELYLMLALPIAFIIVFNYIPMGGAILAFKDYKLRMGIFGSPWADQFGFENFLRFFQNYNFWPTIRNTLILSMYSRCSSGRSARRTVEYAPWVSAFRFPCGAPAPAAFLLPGCPPRFRGGFCASSSAAQLSRLFHLRTFSGFKPTCSATCRAVSVPPESAVRAKTR